MKEGRSEIVSDEKEEAGKNEWMEEQRETKDLGKEIS